jgi:alpha-beta hydrolase superfamily lysophospholipase
MPWTDSQRLIPESTAASPRQLAGVETLMQRYRDAGIYDISHNFYAGGRHEMRNEINRDEVTANF